MHQCGNTLIAISKTCTNRRRKGTILRCSPVLLVQKRQWRLTCMHLNHSFCCLPRWGKRLRYESSKETCMTKDMHSEALSSSISSGNASLFRASEIARFAACSEEDTYTESGIFSSNPLKVKLFKDIGEGLFFILAKGIQNLHNTELIYSNPSKIKLCLSKSAIFSSITPPSLGSQLTIKND